ncbi:MAG: STAS domain-containing protein [Bacteroidetes bacterium]|nr:STAS domain-containing protein [Bacteroidota bacterium]
MKFELDKRDTLAIFKLKEHRLDSTISPAVKGEFVTLLSADGIQNMLVDMTEVSFCDSSGLSCLLVAHRICNNNGGLFGLVGCQPAVEKLIGISHLDRVIQMYDNIEDAVVDFEIQMEDLEDELPEEGEEDEDPTKDPFYDPDLDTFQRGGSAPAAGKRRAAADDDEFDGGDLDEFNDDAPGDDDSYPDFDDSFEDEDLSPRKRK